MNSYSESYKSAGVDVTAGYKAVELMKKHVASTMIPGVVSSIGGFGGMFELDTRGISRPVLVSGTDGVGTKLKVAFILDRHDTVGIDCVAMCVNDIICCGAKPLFFLDYIAVGKNKPERVAQIVSGVAKGCVEAGCALVGGETAEMPGFYALDEYDIAGFTVGLVDRSQVIDGTAVTTGDAIIALPSSGVHSNGFSLIRKIFNLRQENANLHIADLGKTLGEELLTPTRIYVRPVLETMREVEVTAACHITGGGFYENIPRMLTPRHDAIIELDEIKTPPIFKMISQMGNVDRRDMLNTFNMGVGMMLCVPGVQADRAVRTLQENGVDAYIAGQIKRGTGELTLC